MCHPLGAKIISNSLWPLLEKFSRLSCYSQTSTVSTLLLIHLNRGSCKRKLLPLNLLSRRKKILGDSITFLVSCMIVCCVLSHSSFWCFIVFVLLLCLMFFSPIKNRKIWKIQKNSVCLYILVLVYLGWPLKQSS